MRLTPTLWTLRVSMLTGILVAVRGTYINRTVDDEYGDSETQTQPVYVPQDQWAQGSACPNCAVTSLVASNATGKVFHGTWHDSTYHPPGPASEVHITFTGMAVYVYTVIVNSVPGNTGVTTLTDLAFYVDDMLMPHHYQHNQSDITPSVQYDVLVYSNTTLPYDKHTIKIHAGGDVPSLILFDYLIYTVDNTTSGSTTPPTSSTSTKPSSAKLSPSNPLSDSSSPTPLTPSTSSMQSGANSQTKTAVAVTVSVVLFIGIVATLVFFKLRRRRLSPIQVIHDQQPASSAGSVFQRRPTLDRILFQRRATIDGSSVPTHEHFRPLSVEETDPNTRGDLQSISIQLVDPDTFPRPSPPAHRVDVPAPALSYTGTDRSLRLAELMQELDVLERKIRHVEKRRRKRQIKLMEAYPDRYHEMEVPRPGRRDKLAELRLRLEHLKEQIEEEQRLQVEVLPRGQR